MINENRNALFKLTKTHKQQKQRGRFQMIPGKHWNFVYFYFCSKTDNLTHRERPSN